MATRDLWRVRFFMARSVSGRAVSPLSILSAVTAVVSQRIGERLQDGIRETRQSDLLLMTSRLRLPADADARVVRRHTIRGTPDDPL
ncbi:hypothetical protein [Methylobacterium sp. WL9]|uniref:hypothetical protein n=1 Tax=Methylobacterium sp. WL9 TaxID=2603898 RepID=UPI001AEDE3C8|nr:hypothetical protein [Methylobacterium sp. WL9]